MAQETSATMPASAQRMFKDVKNRPMENGDVSQGPDFWRARIGVDPLVDAFSEGIVTHPGVGAEPVAPQDTAARMDALSMQPRRQRTTVYIHVPYCETRCLYCLFYIAPYKDAEGSRRYADYLIRELQMWDGRPALQGRPVEAVYFGGGTPTALEAADIRRILEAVRKYLPLANDCEITFEGRVSNFGDDRMEACLAGGVNRFSLGVQTFDTRIRQAVGRRSDKDTLIRRLEHLMSYNQAAVVIDLIYGFPYQTMQTWQEDLAIAQKLNLDGADCYQLRVFPRSPLFKYIQNGKLPAGPDHTMRARMFEQSVRSMTDALWRRLSVSHWASGTRERNFYNAYAKARCDCLAFGAGAGGTIAGHSYMQHRKIDAWMQAIDAGVKPVAMMLNPAPGWQFNRALCGQMELGVLKPAELAAEFGKPYPELWKPITDNWREAGLIEPVGNAFRLTVAGQFWQTRMNQLLLDFVNTSKE